MTKENKDVEVNEESTDESLKTEEQADVDNQHIPYTRFKEKVDEANALKEKLAEIEKAQKEAERKDMEEKEQYKELYEQAMKQAEQARAEALEVKKSAALIGVGYGEEQAKLLAKLVEGETDEEIAASIENLKTTIPVRDNYGDPNAFNGVRDKPKTVDADEIGVKAYERIKNKIFR